MDVTMTEVFASTAAVTIPVLALAGAIEMREASKKIALRGGKLLTAPFLASAAWAFLILFSLGCEAGCFKFLGKSEEQRRSAPYFFGTDPRYVLWCIAGLLFFLLYFPAVNVFASVMRIVREEQRKKNRAWDDSDLHHLGTRAVGRFTTIAPDATPTPADPNDPEDPRGDVSRPGRRPPA
ncbi:hypothetical protein OG871_01400 [Kitasatospora sp. NBC_00374]|uniref:hypothetical protein n=1 Tax=Kitasatospora sp. NBC_00374 TaxID=2975964 RepID=UPI0030E55847